jgi:5'-3' exonuclease
MTQLRKRFARLREGDIDNVKELLVSFGFTIIDAEGEADVLCARLAIKKRVYACLSDDTDMFVYGCAVVLRHISLLNHSVVSYTMADILAEIGLTQHEFKMMCVVNGTDYDAVGGGTGAAVNVNASDRIFQIYDLLVEFKHLSPKEQKKYQDGGGFYDWIDERKKGVVNSSGVISMMTTEAMFDTSSSSSSSSGNNAGTIDQQYKQLSNRDDIYKHRIMEVMMKDDFIFISDESIAVCD